MTECKKKEKEWVNKLTQQEAVEEDPPGESKALQERAQQSRVSEDQMPAIAPQDRDPLEKAIFEDDEQQSRYPRK